MTRFEIRVALSAMTDIQKISRWWVKHRPASPRLFDRELDAMLGLLEVQPEIGRRVQLKAYGDVHVIMLRRSRYVVVYRIVEQEQAIWIVRVRHGRRRPLKQR
ncbi:MAG TPA: type II toxin-antitoxin system RelE/ParE family toxin [Kofleriaceae bacterium]|nr:type II toxin-antitoxin system RelE/ParE family toxin [Kofleriaceae bacterium]